MVSWYMVVSLFRKAFEAVLAFLDDDPVEPQVRHRALDTRFVRPVLLRDGKAERAGHDLAGRDVALIHRALLVDPDLTQPLHERAPPRVGDLELRVLDFPQPFRVLPVHTVEQE